MHLGLIREDGTEVDAEGYERLDAETIPFKLQEPRPGTEHHIRFTNLMTISWPPARKPWGKVVAIACFRGPRSVHNFHYVHLTFPVIIGFRDTFAMARGALEFAFVFDQPKRDAA